MQIRTTEENRIPAIKRVLPDLVKAVAFFGFAGAGFSENRLYGATAGITIEIAWIAAVASLVTLVPKAARIFCAPSSAGAPTPD